VARKAGSGTLVDGKLGRSAMCLKAARLVFVAIVRSSELLDAMVSSLGERRQHSY